MASGSTLNAGNNLKVTATGKHGEAGSGDIAIGGSQLKAGGDVTLDAQRDLLLSGAANMQKTEGSNKSSGGSVGMSLGVGKNSGLSIFANANSSKGSEHGDGTSWNETTIDSGNKVTLHSGRDTTLKGAQVSGEQVSADVGRNLTLQSQQDSDRYDAKQTSVSGGVSVPIGAGSGSVNLSASRDKLHSNYDSVQEQTGIFAGKGGFDVKVGEHTQLDGAVLASTADKEKNRLETGTLGWSDIHNKADFKAEHSGGSLSTGGPVGKDLLTNMAGGMLSGANNSGHAEGTTKAAVSEGTIAIREQDKQQQDVAELSRDTENANGSIGPIFDKEKEQNRLREAQLIGEIGGMAMDVISTQGDLNGLKAAKEKHPGWSADKLRETKEYQAAMKEYGTGSDLHKAAQALTGALTALAGNNLAGALASGASPYLATEIKKLTTNPQTGEVNVAANAMAHAVLGAVTAQLNNQSAVAGGLGAGGGELAARYIAEQLFPGKKLSELSESEKQQVSALSQLASGLAGGLATGDTAGGVTAAQTGKNAVENNLLGKVLVEGCAIAAPCRSKVAEQLIEIGVKAGIAGVTGAAIKDVADKMTSDELDHLVTLKMMGNDEITGKYLNSLQDKYAPSHTGNNDGQANTGPNHTGNNNSQANTGSNHTGNNDGQISTGPNHTGGDQSAEQLPSNTGNTEGAPDLPNHMESQGYDPRLPIPEVTTASNGLKIESNTKHTPGAQGSRPNAGIEPKNSLDLFERSIATKDPKVRLSIDNDGNIHRFFNTSKDGTGTFHWSGSTGDGKNALGNRELGSFNKEIKELKGKI